MWHLLKMKLTVLQSLVVALLIEVEHALKYVYNINRT